MSSSMHSLIPSSRWRYYEFCGKTVHDRIGTQVFKALSSAQSGRIEASRLDRVLVNSVSTDVGFVAQDLTAQESPGKTAYAAASHVNGELL